MNRREIDPSHEIGKRVGEEVEPLPRFVNATITGVGIGLGLFLVNWLINQSRKKK